MARSLKAFATHSFFTSNEKLVVHTFGEMSTESRTYEKDVQLYSHNTDKNIVLNVLSSMENDRDIEIKSTDRDLALDISKHIYDYTLRGAREIYVDELKRNLLDTFSARAQKFELGDVVTDSSYYCVQWVRFKDLDDNEFWIWFSDQSFRSEYDEYEIDVIFPVENVDVFFSSRVEVEKELAKRPVDVLTRIANSKKANSPVTIFRLDIFKWYNPVKFTPELDTNWYILIWGDAGDTIDAVKDKIQSEILKKSKHSRDEWKKVFPDIFKRNEFIIVPQWDNLSNENKVREQASLYSPFVTLSTAVEKYCKPFMADMSETHINANVQAVSLYYRAVAALVCGSPENKENKFKLQEIFPDFIDVPSTSTDFGYQSANTQAFSLKIQDMLAVAETMTPTSSLPRERITLAGGEMINGEKIFTRTTRNNKLFLVMKYKDVHYLIAAKHNFLK
jgi:PHIKZ157